MTLPNNPLTNNLSTVVPSVRTTDTGNLSLLPLISPSQWNAYPTGLSGQILLPGGTQLEQTLALFTVIQQATSYADEYCFGGYGGFVARNFVQEDRVRILNGTIKLRCIVPPLALTGLNFPLMNYTTPLSPTAQISGRIITYALDSMSFDSTAYGYFSSPYASGDVWVQWMYVGGWAHTSLAEDVISGATTITLTPNQSNGTVAGLYVGQTLWIQDPINGVEPITIQSVSGSTVTLQDPLQFAHTIPANPDFIAVTAVPESVRTAAILLTSMYVLNRGDQVIALNPMRSSPPVQGAGSQSDLEQQAINLLSTYTVRWLG